MSLDFTNLKTLTIDGVSLKSLHIDGTLVWQAGVTPTYTNLLVPSRCTTNSVNGEVTSHTISWRYPQVIRILTPNNYIDSGDMYIYFGSKSYPQMIQMGGGKLLDTLSDFAGLSKWNVVCADGNTMCLITIYPSQLKNGQGTSLVNDIRNETTFKFRQIGAMWGIDHMVVTLDEEINDVTLSD
jgi:hypothetical protein